MNKTILALFDLDKTLIPLDSDYSWGVFLGRHGYVDVAEYTEKNARFYEQYTQGTLDIFAYSEFVFKVLSEHPMGELLRWRTQFMAEFIEPMITPQAEHLVQRHLKAGHTCVLISATNEFVITPIAERFGFDAANIIGTTPEQIDGKFTGKVAGVPSFQNGKITRLEQWLSAHELTWADIGMSFFYSDSINDLPLLETVDFPMICNPDERLRAIAHVRYWAITELFKPSK